MDQFDKARWSDDALALLKRELLAGSSSSQIARKLNSQLGTVFTRNAIIGKVHRMSLPRPERQRIPRQARGHRRHKAPKPQKFALVIQPAPTTPAEPRYACSAEIPEQALCRWIDGDVQDRNYHFCGRPAKENSPYCPEHHRLCYVPNSALGDKHKAFEIVA